MLFPVRRLVEFISSVITLVPGDIIATGTPAGVGAGMQPPVFMSAGDVIEVEVEGIGVLRNTIVAASERANPALAGSAAA
jgi:2-keto-4-pentenoate hydratase/2-oxohepta-3-ene-1,7-dioic acid hydratase in catechol pathway